MKKHTLAFLLILCLQSAHSQLTKGIWLAGGTGSFSSMKNAYSTPTYSQNSDVIDIAVSPNIGYFVADKFPLGLKLSYSKNKAQVTTSSGLYTNVNRFEFGPFARYYFLKADDRYNLLAEVSYQYGIYRFTPDKGNINTFSAAAGPVLFFNSSVGLEFLIGYYRRNEVVNDSYKTEQKGLQMSIGFQIHLEK